MSQDDIEKLLGLAADRSHEARKELIHAIIDFFLPDRYRLTEQQRALMTDVLTKLVKSIEMDVRRNLAEMLLRSEVDLPELERMLANDEIEVARPLLEQSKVLQDSDLIEIVKKRTDQHRLAIAMRDRLSEPVADALIEHGSPDVIEALIRNEDAALSRRAMEYLVAESRRLDRFQEPLLSRSDLPPELAHRMYWWVSAALRRRILTEFTIDEETLDAALQSATRQAVVEMEDGQSLQARAHRLARRLQELGELTDTFLLQVLRQQRVALFLAGICERAQIDSRIGWHIISSRQLESFIVLARAIGMSRDIMAHIVLLLGQVNNPLAMQRPEVLTTILKLYDELDPARAERVLKLWQRDASYVLAIDGVQHGAD
ncbi:DUF2336 domain-containing protein [Pedomonas mirosovicensis]|uniref:DUF2336 domain-containing protein n=1 Tax=Pedomonas mirosovicensis TaxID=2908641 RepID=UPI0021678CB3|nr:DUF2336 domain-containing protein [Pedomonas mirosovicensis]MCH8685477.1 DUF2336 domain-containing protein [Pedomonas mirosovicensis]